jgi:hypothetical protein
MAEVTVQITFEAFGSRFEATTQMDEEDVEIMDWDLLLAETSWVNNHEVIDG